MTAMRIETTLAQMRATSDWKEAFAFADGFTLDDVAEIVGSVDGDNDGDDWLAVGRLNSGVWFALSAGCDYSGWDCHAAGRSWAAETRETIEACLSAADRDRLGVAVQLTDGEPL